MHLQSLREPLELFEACADLNASGISWSYEHAVHIIKLLSNGEGVFFPLFFLFLQLLQTESQTRENLHMYSARLQ